MRAMKRITQVVLTLLVACFVPLARADYYIAVSDKNPVAAMSQQDVLHLYMGRTRTFSDGRSANRYDLASEQMREGFYRSLAGMSLPQISSYWARLMFSGRNLPPQQLHDEEALASKLLNDPRAIGWFAAEPRQKGLKVLLVLRDTR